MSDDLTPEVTSSELNDWLQRDRKKQKMVADRLIISDRTIDGWRHGGSIPPRYQVLLRQMMNGEDSMVLSLPPETIARIAAQATAKGYKSKEAYISELLKGFMILCLAGGVTWLALAEKTVGAQADFLGIFKTAKEWVIGLTAK